MSFRAATSGSLSVVWTRGRGCGDLADLLAPGESGRISGDPAEECIERRADLLVARKLPGNFDLVSVAVPIDFRPDMVTRVVAGVAGGPHSLLAAQVAALLAEALGVPAEIASAAGAEDDAGSAAGLLDQIGADLPSMGRRLIEVGGVAELAETLDEGALLVLGAPGGSWLRRWMLGPGARLRRTARAGAVVVRSAPDRVFRFMGEPVYVAPLRRADDTLLFHLERTLAVADQGRLVGLVRRERLMSAGEAAVGTVMEEAVSVRVDETITTAWRLAPEFGDDPIPVTDHEEFLVGGLLLPVA